MTLFLSVLPFHLRLKVDCEFISVVFFLISRRTMNEWRVPKSAARVVVVVGGGGA